MNRRTEQGRTEFVVKGCLTRLALAFQFSEHEAFTRDEVVQVILSAWDAYERGKMGMGFAPDLLPKPGSEAANDNAKSLTDK